MRFLYLLFAIMLISCSSNKKNVEETITAIPIQNTAYNSNPQAAMPKAVIYKTTADYSNLVPITLNNEKNSIVSYPDPSDIDNSQKPVALNNGYWLDRRGISLNSVFTSFTYDEYSKLTSLPSKVQLINSIVNKNPFTEIYVLPISINEANKDKCNEFIKNNFNNCKKIK